MQLTERHRIGKNSEYYKILDNEAFKSKNLYNAALYAIRQQYQKDKTYVNYYTLQHKFQTEKQHDYYQLPAKVSQQTLKLLDQNYRAYFAALKAYKKNPNTFSGAPRPPKYLDKEKGRCALIYTSQAISKRCLERDGLVKLGNIDVYVHTNIPYAAIRQVRAIRKTNCYYIEIVYESDVVCEPVNPNGKCAAIDLGVSNFATVTSNINGFQPFVIDGRGVKSINRYYNKEKAEAQSLLELRSNNKNGNHQKSSHRTRRLTEKRNNKIKDFLHKASRMVVNQLVSNDIKTLIVGYNKGWKQDTNMGKVNNQNFVQLPYERFLFMLKYKCEMAGIELITVEESHTSKCSFLDGEEICHHDEYMGRRIKRGLFRTKSGRLINADVNGSYNIMLKGMPKAFAANGVEGVLVHPVVIKATN